MKFYFKEKIFKNKEKLADTFELHSRVEAFFEAAGRAFFARGDGDRTGGAPKADVVLLVLHGSLEEALTALAREDAVVEARDFVAADGARAVDELLPGDAGLRRQRSRVLGKIRRIQALLLTRSLAAVIWSK